VDERREKFCAGVASGLSLTAAARAAGYRGDKGNSSRMAKAPEVAARIRELRELAPPIIVAEPEPQVVPLTAMHNGQHKPNRIREFEQIRDAALGKGHTSAAATAQRDLVKAERVVQATDHKNIDIMKLARMAIPHIEAAMRSGGNAATVVARMLGIVDPKDLAALGVKPKPNGHTRPA
jgi:phage terminase small subunit